MSAQPPYKRVSIELAQGTLMVISKPEAIQDAVIASRAGDGDEEIRIFFGRNKKLEADWLVIAEVTNGVVASRMPEGVRSVTACWVS
jgi:hypothetical protein